MAQRGQSYQQILAHYFPGTSTVPSALAPGERQSRATSHFRLVHPQTIETREVENVLGLLESTRSDLLRRVSAAGLQPRFPDLEIVINGGITTREQIQEQLKYVDGVMIGRAAYSNPWFLADEGKTRAQVVQAMADYARRQDSLRHVTRHMLGLYHATPRAKLWRRMLSEPLELKKNDPGLILRALDAVEGRLAEAA